MKFLTFFSALFLASIADSYAGIHDKCIQTAANYGTTHGNWSLFDNTGNFDRFTVSGADYYKKVRGSVGRGRIVKASRCSQGNAKVDSSGVTDQCVATASITEPRCYSVSGAKVAPMTGSDFCTTSTGQPLSETPKCTSGGIYKVDY
jgi:hypothetical protein